MSLKTWWRAEGQSEEFRFMRQYQAGMFVVLVVLVSLLGVGTLFLGWR